MALTPSTSFKVSATIETFISLTAGKTGALTIAMPLGMVMISLGTFSASSSKRLGRLLTEASTETDSTLKGCVIIIIPT